MEDMSSERFRGADPERDSAPAQAGNPKEYARLLTGTLPATIKSEADYERLLAHVEALMERNEDDLSPGESTLLELLAMLIEDYEEHRYPPRAVTPQAI